MGPTSQTQTIEPTNAGGINEHSSGQDDQGTPMRSDEKTCKDTYSGIRRAGSESRNPTEHQNVEKLERKKSDEISKAISKAALRVIDACFAE